MMRRRGQRNETGILGTMNFGNVAGRGVLYSIHPFIKFLVLLLVSISLFFIRSLLLTGVLLLMILLVFKASHLDLRRMISMFRWVLAFSALLVPIDALFNISRNVTGDVLFYLFSPQIPVRRYALYIAARSSAWIACLCTTSSIFIMTTKPRDLVTGLIEGGIPYGFAYTLQVVFRYMPVVQEEAGTIDIAQKLRGRDLKKKRSFRDRIEVVVESFSTLLVNLFRHAFQTAVSMEKRAFRLHGKRTRTHRIGLKTADVLFTATSVVFTTVLLLLDNGMFFGITVPSIMDILGFIFA